MHSPRVSVVIPTLNAARFFKECLNSVVSQSFQDFEIVIVDDGSTDGTLDIARQYGDRVRVIEKRRIRKLKTPELARYEGVKAARGHYCALIDADDVWLAGKLLKQVEFLDAHPELPMCHTYVRVIDEQGNSLGVRHEGIIPPTGPCAVALMRHCIVSTSSVLVRREAWLSSFSEADFDCFPDEWHFFIEICRNAPIGFIPDVMALYRWRETSHSRKLWHNVPHSIRGMIWTSRRGLWRGVISKAEMRAILREAFVENVQYLRDRNDFRRALYFGAWGICHAPLSGELWLQTIKSLLKPIVKRSSP